MRVAMRTVEKSDNENKECEKGLLFHHEKAYCQHNALNNVEGLSFLRYSSLNLMTRPPAGIPHNPLQENRFT